MYDYEDLYTELQPLEKELKDSASAAVRLQKSIQKDTETGNLTNIRKSLANLKDTVVALNQAIGSIEDTVEGFDARAYFADGDFSRQLLEACQTRGVDVKGDLGIYEMFPYKVRVTGDMEHDGEVYINRKKLPTFRPAYVADYVRDGQQKLFKAKFNEKSFMTEIADAYKTSCLKSGSRIGSTQKLDKIYKAMVPMSRSKKEYDILAFAFDLSRIYEAGPDAWVTKTGERYYFGTSRDGKSGYRVLSSTGVESFVNTLKLLHEDE